MTEVAARFEEAFTSPILRGLDPRALRDVAQAGRVITLKTGDVLYELGARADTLFIVLEGEVRLEAVRRGEDRVSTVRVARRGDSFGEESTVVGTSRVALARAAAPSHVAEVSVSVLTRARVRGGVNADVVARDERALRRAAARDVLASSALGRELPRDDQDLVLDRAEWRHIARGERLHSAGEPAGIAFVIVAGLLQLQTEDDGRVRVRGYLTRGDLVGEDDVLGGRVRSLTAVALGDLHVLTIPREVLRSALDRSPGLLERLGRVSLARDDAQRTVVDDLARGATQHVFRDLYRMQVARSLLVIDNDSCVRCGHCAWACAETHGVSHLIRRGDKIVTQLSSAGAPTSLLVPNSCQHCDNPACMLDCPTGAIGRDPRGEVFIRPELCTGCGACVRACPWDNIQMSPREGAPPTPKGAPDGGVGTSAMVAAKCDLCRQWDAPACVSVCPTGAILRVDPTRDFGEMTALFGGPGPSTTEPAARRQVFSESWVLVAVASVSLALVGLLLGLHRAGVLDASRGVGYWFGVLALPACLVLAAYGVFKRGVRFWLGRRQTGARRQLETEGAMSRSRVAPQFVLHVTLGFVTLALVAGHGGLGGSPSASGALGVVFWVLAGSGVIGVVAYRLIPRALSRIERRGLLPEDFRRERELNFDRLYRAMSGKSELVKVLAERVLLPYARAPFGGLVLLLSGRTLAEEEERLRGRLDQMLQGRGGDKSEGLPDLVRIVVEIRALGVRRGATALLRSIVPVHVVLAGLFLGLLAVHLFAVIGGGE